MIEAAHLPLFDRPGVHCQQLPGVQKADQVGPADPPHLLLLQSLDRKGTYVKRTSFPFTRIVLTPCERSWGHRKHL